MSKTHSHQAGQPASFADFLSLWEDLRDDDADKPQSETAKPGGLAEAVSTLGLGWIGAAMLAGKTKQR